MNSRASFLILLFLFLEVTSGAQQIIRGMVIDQKDKEPVPSVYVSDINTGETTVSDENGRFQIIRKGEKEVMLAFSHLCYKKQVCPVKYFIADTVIQVQLCYKVTELNGVDIMAPAIKQVLTQSYSQTNIDEMVIEEKIATALIDVLEQVPGITKRGEYHSPLAMRGLGGKRLLVTKDGNRRMGNFPGGFMGQGVNIYDLAKVEVIKGPASVKYGPGAITGIINMESKSPFLQPGIHGRTMVSYGANNQEQTVMASVNHATLDHALSFSARYRNAGDFFYGKGIEAENSNYRDKDFRISYTWENDYSFLLNAESELHLGGPWGRPVDFNGTNQMRMYNPNDNIWHTSVTARWKPGQMLKQAELSCYYDREYREQIKDSYDTGSGLLSYREDVQYRNQYGGWRGLAILLPAHRLQLSVGTDGVLFRIDSPTEYTDYFLNSIIKNRVARNSGVFLGGAFAEAEYQTSDNRFKFKAGLRSDYSLINEGDVHDTTFIAGRTSNVFSWNATSGVVFSNTGNVYYSLQIARSSRMPDATEMFIMSSNTDGVVYGNPDLTPEYGLNIDCGVRGNIGWLSFDCSLFSNFLHDFISLEYWINSGKKGINYTYYNIDRARISGAELSVGVKCPHFFHPDNVLNYGGIFVYTQGDKLTDAPDWFSKGDPLRAIPPFNLSQEVTFRRLVSSSLSFYFGGDVRYYATQNRIAPSSEGGYVSLSYCLFGASVGITYRRASYKWELKLKGDNLVDNKYHPFETLVYGMGRNVKVMLSMSF